MSVKVWARLAPQYAFDEHVMADVDWSAITDEELANGDFLGQRNLGFRPDVVVLSGWRTPAFRRLPSERWGKRPLFVLAADTPSLPNWRQRLAPIVLYPFLRNVDAMMVPGYRDN